MYIKKLLLFFLCFFLLIPHVCAYGYVVMDLDSGRIIASENMNNKELIASTTKIMTCIIVLENSSLDQMIKVGEEVLSMYGTNIYIEVGEELSVKDLLYGLMLRSGNDAAIVLAVHTLGEENFIQKMNEKAIEIGMNHTVFANPHGLDDVSINYSTAYDMALLSRYAYQNSIYREIISTKKYVATSSLKTYVWNNRMSLIRQYSNCIGGKNGYTPKAGKSLVSYARKDKKTFTIVSLDDDSIYENHRYLYEKYFSLYDYYLIIDAKNFFIERTFSSKTLYLKQSFSYLLSKEEVDNVTTLVKLYPTTKNQKAGVVKIYLKGKEIGSLDVYEEKEVQKKKSFFQKSWDFLWNSIKK